MIGFGKKTVRRLVLYMCANCGRVLLDLFLECVRCISTSINMVSKIFLRSWVGHVDIFLMHDVTLWALINGTRITMRG